MVSISSFFVRLLMKLTGLVEFHDDLDFVSVHERLIAEFEECCTTSKSRKSTDAKIAAVLKAKASRLERSGSKALIGVWISFFCRSSFLS